jgi:hypothetical protein
MADLSLDIETSRGMLSGGIEDLPLVGDLAEIIETLGFTQSIANLPMGFERLSAALFGLVEAAPYRDCRLELVEAVSYLLSATHFAGDGETPPPVLLGGLDIASQPPS